MIYFVFFYSSWQFVVILLLYFYKFVYLAWFHNYFWNYQINQMRLWYSSDFWLSRMIVLKARWSNSLRTKHKTFSVYVRNCHLSVHIYTYSDSAFRKACRSSNTVQSDDAFHEFCSCISFHLCIFCMCDLICAIVLSFSIFISLSFFLSALLFSISAIFNAPPN